MNDEDKKIEIEDAVRVFKETLEKTYLGKDEEFYGIGIHHLTRFFSGKCQITRKTNGNLRMSGEISSLAFNENCKGLPREIKDWNFLPLVVVLHQKKME